MQQTTRIVAAFDLDWARAQFPSLGLPVGVQPAAYFDNPGGTQVPARTIDAIGKYLMTANSNTGGPFLTSRRTDEVIADARAATAAFLGAADPREIVFGPNMTTLTFAFSRALGRTLKPGDEILVTELDHDANIAPWLMLAADLGLEVRKVPFRPDDCTLDLDQLAALLSPRTRLVAVGRASNATGSVTDVAEVARLAHEVGALVYVDAVHFAPHGPIDVQALGIDFLACSAYKFFGPHLGILWGRGELLDAIPAYKVRPAHDEPPDKFETGTKNHEALAGLLATLSYVADLGRTALHGAGPEHGAMGTVTRPALLAAMNAIAEYEKGLSALMLEGLSGIPGVRIYGICDSARLSERVPTFALTIDGVDTEAMNQALADEGIFAWTGNYYALDVMTRLGLEGKGGALRVGAAHYNTTAEVERLIAALHRIAGK